MAFAMTVLFLIFRLSFLESQSIEFSTRTFIEVLDCSTYLPGLNEDLYREALKQLLENNNVKEGSVFVEAMHFVEGRCVIKMRVKGDYIDYRESVVRALTIAYGESWGCRMTTVNVPVTSFYSAKITVPDISSMGLSDRLFRKCKVPILQWQASIEVVCKMNDYGGYLWELGEHSRCFIPEFEKPSLEKAELLKGSPFYCQFRIFMTVGTFLSQQSETNCNLLPTLKDFHDKCKNPERWVYESAYREWFSITDATLTALEFSGGCPNYPVYVTRVAKTLFQIMVDPVLSYFDVYAETTYHRSQKAELYTFNEAPEGELHLCEKSYTVYPISVSYPLIVACFDVPVEEEVERLSLFPFLSVGFILVQELKPSKNFQIYVRFGIPDFHQRGQYNCSSSWDGKHSWSMFHSCKVIQVHRDYVTCKCYKPGLLALWQYPPPRKRNVLIHNDLNGISMTALIYLDIVAHAIGLLWQLLFRLSPENRWLDFGLFLNDMSLIPIIDMDIQRTIINTLILMVHRYNINPANEEQCQLSGPVWNALVLTATYMDIFIVLVMITAPRDERLLDRFWQFVLMLHIAGFLTFLWFYNSTTLNYYNINFSNRTSTTSTGRPCV
ncbi:unnamed protein product [Calicophoron daubneyi]|uniref:Uncharacterized protein n=1 Tax=Calicophoron daubneyi TaxID=300641 RepID=A0AAV2TK35_CALDB